MRLKLGWLIVMVVIALLAAACGPQADAPTLGDQATAEQSDVTVVAESPTTAPEAVPTETVAEGSPPSEFPVDEDDWHVLGSPDAPITMVEYADFQ